MDPSSYVFIAITTTQQALDEMPAPATRFLPRVDGSKKSIYVARN